MLILTPENFHQALNRATEHGLEVGALQPINTQVEMCHDADLTFTFRVLAGSKQRKAAATLSEDGSAPRIASNPFLPFDQDLYVGHLDQAYVCLLNKFNVIPNHFLVVTAEFQEQTEALTLEDFQAAEAVLKALPSLIFFNGGKLAGASQRHKHLQAIPLPGPSDTEHREPDQTNPIPLNQYLEALPGDGTQVPAFNFQHRFRSWTEFSAHTRFEDYLQSLKMLKLNTGHQSQPGAYNLLMTQRWSLMVPRQREHFEGMSVNSLGFAGTLLARNPEQLVSLRATGPLRLLQEVSFARC